MLRLLSALLLSLVFVTAAPAQQPEVVHAQLTTQTADHGLAVTIESFRTSATPVWLGYVVPTATSYSSGWNNEHITYLEREGYTVSNKDDHTPARPESNRAVILIRITAGKVDKVRSSAPDETIDAGNQRFVWLTNITPEDSVATLKALTLAPASTHVADSTIFLISLHRSTATLPALVSLATEPNPAHIREQATFWIANQQGHEGFLALEKLARDPAPQNEQLREKLAFDFTLSKDPAATGELIRMAHNDPAPAVRRQAQFWMATRGGKLVTAALHDSADNDRDADTRKQAVFAISRLPAPDATTQLCALADTSKYPEVRKQAVFWLGQSNDPRALDYLTRLLTASSH